MRRLLSIACALCLALAVPAGVVAAPPANDLPGGAVAIGSTIPATVNLDTTEATVTTDDFGCGQGGLDQATVWYTFTPAADISLLVDATASDYAVGVNLFEGGPTADTLVNCFEGPGLHEFRAGVAYFLMFADVDGNATNGGQLAVTVDVAPPPIAITLTVDAVGKVNQRTGTATLTGTITCSEVAQDAFLEVSVSQRVGRFTIRGFGFSGTACGPDPAPWWAEVTGDNGKLAGGQAVVRVLAVVCGTFQCSDTELVANVRLRR